eukprot:scaffold2626_cov279-Pinguiococcus_pyrenoidosus.AAC.7
MRGHPGRFHNPLLTRERRQSAANAKPGRSPPRQLELAKLMHFSKQERRPSALPLRFPGLLCGIGLGGLLLRLSASP